MVDFAIMKANKPGATPNFHFIFLAKNHPQKLHFFIDF